MAKLLIFLTAFFSINFSAQQDYAWMKMGKYQTAVLNDSLKENSGLNFLNGALYTFNDSGNSAEIFQINKNTGAIEKVFQTGLQNIDWEAISSDSENNLYIGDFGNNLGNRKNLSVYKFQMPSSGTQLQGIKLPFYYPEQKTFEPKNLNNDFDAEAMIFAHEKIHIFTKEWFSKNVTHYTIDPNNLTEQAAQKIESFPTGFVVTDAAYYEGKLYFVGYTKTTEVYFMLFEETQAGIFFSVAHQKFYLGSSLSLGQIEGIAVDADGIYISGEEFRSPIGKTKAKLYFIPHSKVAENTK